MPTALKQGPGGFPNARLWKVKHDAEKQRKENEKKKEKEENERKKIAERVRLVAEMVGFVKGGMTDKITQLCGDGHGDSTMRMCFCVSMEDLPMNATLSFSENGKMISLSSKKWVPLYSKTQKQRSGAVTITNTNSISK
jgi:hypothetical protein